MASPPLLLTINGYQIVIADWWLRRDTEDELYSANELLRNGQACVQTQDAEGYDSYRFKIGNDVDHWRDLLWAGWGLIDLSELADGHVPMYDAAQRRWKTTSGSGQVPTRIPAGGTYTVLEEHQVLFRRPILVEGCLAIDGELIEV